MSDHLCPCDSVVYDHNDLMMGKDMEMKINNRINSLLPAERMTFAAHTGLLLIGLGNMLKNHPELRTEVSPNSGTLLVNIGEKLMKICR